jgi:VanZ family protein
VKSSQRNFWRGIWIVSGIYWLILFVLTHLPPDKIPKTNVSDKTEHLVAYGLLAAVVHLSLWPRRWPIIKLALGVIGVCMVYGVFDETTQPIVGRTCDIHDWLADITGAGTSILLMSLAMIIAQRGAARDPSAAQTNG